MVVYIDFLVMLVLLEAFLFYLQGIVFRDIGNELEGILFIIHPAAIVLYAVADNEIVHLKNKVIPCNL